MSWDDFEESLRRRVQTERQHDSKLSVAGSILRLAVAAGVLLAAVIIPGAAFMAVTANNVSNDIVSLPLNLEDRPNPQTTRLYASDGSLLAYFYQENRQDVPLEEISANMTDAIVSIEDNRFFEHGALDIKGTLRALVNNASEGQTQGGSSITQQLVKLTLVQQATTKEQVRAATEKSASRKLRELKLAIAYEKKHSKKEILERYLNIAYFGDGAYGIQSAAHHYFSVSPAKLTVAQAAVLAGLVKNPVEFDPLIYPERALQRRNTVLAVMARLGKIDQAKAEKIMAKPLGLKVTKFPNGCVTSVGAFSCDYIRRYLLEDKALGETYEERRQQLERGGLVIKSNIDIRMQKAANAAVNSTVAPTDEAIGALAMIEPGTGKVRALAQSRPMGTKKKQGETFLNFTVPTSYGQSHGFQAGSTFKLFTAAAALKAGFDVGKTYASPQSMLIPAGTYFDCEGRGTGAWPVANSTGSGTMNMYSGMRKSINTYFAQLERDVGLCKTVRMAEAMGITVPYDPENGVTNQVPSFTLGVTDVSPMDMAGAYATAASGGMYCEPNPVNEIVDSQGEVIKKYKSDCKRVLSKDEAAQLNDILKGLQQPGGFGYSNGTALNIPSAAKTGTTNENMAVWYVGYTPELATASMIAGADSKGRPHSLVGKTLNGRAISFGMAGGSSLAGPMWKAAMGKIQEYLSPTPFDPPPKGEPVVRVEKKDTKKKKKDDD